MVKCEICGEEFLVVNNLHLRLHNLDSYSYRRMFPGAETYSKEMVKVQAEVHKYQAEAQRGSIQSSDICERKRKAQLARWADTTKEERMEYYRNSFGSEKAKENLAISKQAYWDRLTPEEKEERLRGYLHTEEVWEKIGEANRRVWAALSPEERKARLDATIHSDESMRASAEACARKPNKTELLLWEFLDEAFPGLFLYNGDRKVRIGRRFPDFISRNGFKLVLETFGPYWHGPLVKDGEEEEKAKADYKELGYECIVVWISNEDDVIVEWPNLKKTIARYTRLVKI